MFPKSVLGNGRNSKKKVTVMMIGSHWSSTTCDHHHPPPLLFHSSFSKSSSNGRCSLRPFFASFIVLLSGSLLQETTHRQSEVVEHLRIFLLNLVRDLHYLPLRWSRAKLCLKPHKHIEKFALVPIIAFFQAC
mmetsp:Transcript_6607/g.10501  ORF Transcript_6607/g.10501 Transcript_6607/m.10501 type:complete len:133 (-) Transcript_6607:562-960(-)